MALRAAALECIVPPAPKSEALDRPQVDGAALEGDDPMVAVLDVDARRAIVVLALPVASGYDYQLADGAKNFYTRQEAAALRYTQACLVHLAAQVPLVTRTWRWLRQTCGVSVPCLSYQFVYCTTGSLEGAPIALVGVQETRGHRSVFRPFDAAAMPVATDGLTVAHKRYCTLKEAQRQQTGTRPLIVLDKEPWLGYMDSQQHLRPFFSNK